MEGGISNIIYEWDEWAMLPGGEEKYEEVDEEVDKEMDKEVNNGMEEMG